MFIFSSKFDDHDYENYKHRAPATSTQQMQLSDSPTFRAGQALSSTTPGDVSPPDDSSYNYIQPSNSSNVSTAVPISQLTTIQKSPQLDSRFRRSSLPSPELRSNDAIQRTKSIELQDLVSKKSLQNEKDKEAEIISSVKSAAALACEEVPKSSIDSSSPSSDKVIPPVLASKSIGMSQSVEIRGVIVASVRSADVSSVLSQGNIGDHSKSRLDHIPQQPHQWRVLPPRRGQVGPHPSYAVALPPRNIPRKPHNIILL